MTVASTSRYGLPVNFQAILIHPNKKNQKRLRDVLNQLYGHLDGSAAGSSSVNADVSWTSFQYAQSWLIFLFSSLKQNVDIPGLGFGQSEYFPYVFYKMSVDMMETKI